MKKLVFSFGRFNPPTTGHEVLLKKVVAVSKKENADAMVYSSQSNDPKKNPLPYKEKTKFMKAMFPKHKKVIQYDIGVKNAFDTLSTVYAKGYRDVTMVVGSDRVTEFEKILNKYNDVEGRHGYYNFENGVKVVSAGARDPDAEGVTGMSASKMRAAAAANDFESFEKGMPAGFKGGQSVFDAVRKGMNLSEEMMEFMESDIEGLREFFETDLVDSLDVIDDEELFESIDEDFGAVPDFATMLAFGMAAKMSFDAVKMLVRTAKGVNKVRKWAKRNGNKLRDKVNPAPNFTQFESLNENQLGRYATAARAMTKRDNAAKDAVQAAGGKDPRTNEPKTPEEWMARREYHLKYAARKGMTQPMKDLISRKTMGIHKKSASECREIHNIITGTRMDAMGNWKPNEKLAVREYPHSTPDHITREYNKKKQQYRKRLQSLQTSEHEDTKDLKRKTERPWYDAMKKHFASHGYISDVPKPDPLDFGITWKIGSDGKMPHRPYMESVQNGLIGLDQIKKFESVVDKLFAKYDIDFNFTRHFGDRMDDSRNNPSITLKELAEFIKKMYKRQGKSIKGVAGAEAVLKDIQSDLNIPVAVTYDRNNDEFDVVLKTIMRKKNFTSPDKVIKYEENDMTNQLPEGFMDAILGKNMKKRDSGNAEQVKITTDINRKLTLIDGLMKKVKPLGGKMTRLTSFRKTPIKKMTPKDLYRALNDWYLSIDDYLNDNPEVDKRHGSTVVKLYSVWEEVADKIQDYMWASGYNVERGKRGKRGAPNKMGNIIADVKMSKGPVMVQTKKLKVDGKLVDIDYNVPKRTDAKWLKMNESRVKNVVRGMGVDPDNVMRGMGFKEASELDELKIDMPKKGAGLGITRDKMPQVDEKDYPEYFAYLKEKGITLKKGKEDPNKLKPIQKEFAKIGVEKSLDKMLAKKDNAKFIIVSKDDYIVDGHHRWLAAKNGRQQLNVMRANVNMKELLKATNEFPKTTFKSIKNVVKNMQEVRQDSDVKDKKGTQPSKYYAADADGDKMSKSTKEKRAAYFAKGGSKKPAPGDKGAKTKESEHTKRYRKMFGETKPCWDGYTQQGMKKKGGKMVPNCVPEETINEKIDGLVKKSEKSGISYGILKKVYDRGMAAWKSGHRPGTTAQQWAFARVNSFVTKGKGTWGKADKDLAAKVRSESFLPFNEKLDPNKDDMSDYVKDFKKSKAPQFKGKSDDKRKQMAVAAYLAAKEKTESVDEDRDYKKERKNYLGTPEQMERNAARSRARRLAIKKGIAERGDGRDIHHKDNNPMNNDPKNLSSVTQKYNRSEPRKRNK